MAMRAVIADDILIVRTGLARLLEQSEVSVVGDVADAPSLLRLVAAERPDVAIIDIRMPPTMTDEGLTAARRIRTDYPGTAVLLLSEYLRPTYASRLLADRPAGLGYLLKGRVSDRETLLDALRRVTRGECVVDPGIVERLMADQSNSPLAQLTPRERDVLAAVAEGRSNAAIATRLGLSERTVEDLCGRMFRKLELETDPDVNRRVLAVLAFLRARRISPPPR
jgi:DNA-binding NarL/FixJ family response regulator